MTRQVKYSIAQIAVFLWLGFVLAISFMEAWLKFQAPGITVPLGLGIGQLVFRALNLMEWVFALAGLATLFFSKDRYFTGMDIYFFLPIFLLVLQSTWLLPALDVRAEKIIKGMELPGSNLHFVYVGMEIVKVICLCLYGIKMYKIEHR